MAKKRKSSMRDKVGRNAKKQQAAGSQYGYLSLPRGVNMFNPKPKSTVSFDIIPYRVTSNNHPDKDERLDTATKGEIWYRRPFLIHRNIGGGNDAVVCLRTINKRCPICEYRSDLMKKGGDADEAKTFKASKRNLYIVIPIDDDEHKEEPHLLDISQFLFQELLNDEVAEKEDACMFPDLEAGLTLEVRFKMGKIGKTEFAEASRIDFHERDKAYDEGLPDEVPNLDEGILSILSYKALQAKFFEHDVDEDEKPKEPELDEDGEEINQEPEALEDEPPEEKPEPRKPKTGSMKRGKKEDSKDDKKVQRRKAREDKKKKEKSEDGCPHGHTLGKDIDEYDEDCGDCAAWDACNEAAD